MKQSLHERLRGRDLDLREQLAAARSILANERTLLAYLRTALTALVAAITLIKLFDGIVPRLLGWALLPVAFAAAGIGLRRYWCMRRLLQDMDRLSLENPCLKNENKFPF